ncbi:hypothetical protein GQ44DRAFT_90141 [Phaeosphaeriaceae sp. PMI808]|nr:hypothetical protein GQ44DRAFT_90141 [Phaeosphaeriaceae sp. PMI808]
MMSTPAQLEAKNILAYLFDKLNDQDTIYYQRYGEWIQRHPDLAKFCFQCIRPQVWTFLNGRWSFDALNSVGGDIRSEGRAIYLNSILGLDRKVRIYVGQANSIRVRTAQHLNFRYRRDNPSLHYHAMQQSIYNAFGVLALVPPTNASNKNLPGMDCPNLLLNILEMWMTLVFRTLPPQTLEEWLPDDDMIKNGSEKALEGDFRGLNIASPLDHGEKPREWLTLSESSDPVVRDYLGLGRKSSEIEKRKSNYTERARSYNTKKRQENGSSQAVGLVLVVTMAFLIGTALLRSSGGPGPRLTNR